MQPPALLIVLVVVVLARHVAGMPDRNHGITLHTMEPLSWRSRSRLWPSS